jgi:hypothetical protein
MQIMMNKSVFAVIFFGISGMTMAEDQKEESSSEAAFDPRNASSAPVEKIVKEGRTCYKETSIQKMVEACYEGKTYYTPLTEKTRVKIKCPAKAKTHE